MKLKSNFASGLDFTPSQLWPDTVPALALNQQLLCGFHLKANHPVFEHPLTNHESTLRLFKSVYPQLTLPELARLSQAPAFNEYFDIASVMSAYQYKFTPELQDTLKLLADAPFDFQNFVALKKIGPQELTPLIGLKGSTRTFVIEEILRAQESKQDSVKRLELISDLLQMNHPEESLKNLKLVELTQKRFPVTSARDQSLSEAPFSWSSKIRSEFKRRGDKAGFEVQFFAGTPAELTKLAQNLTQVAQEWNSQG